MLFLYSQKRFSAKAESKSAGTAGFPIITPGRPRQLVVITPTNCVSLSQIGAAPLRSTASHRSVSVILRAAAGRSNGAASVRGRGRRCSDAGQQCHRQPPPFFPPALLGLIRRQGAYCAEPARRPAAGGPGGGGDRLRQAGRPTAGGELGQEKQRDEAGERTDSG